MAYSETTLRNNEPAFVLHTYPYRETSLIVEALSRHAGRIALVARGAKRPRSAIRGQLLSFQPLELSWSGKNEPRTMHKAEWRGGQPMLQGLALLCGFYMNELLLKLLPRDDPHETLFDIYAQSLMDLSRQQDLPVVRSGRARRFVGSYCRFSRWNYLGRARTSRARCIKRSGAVASRCCRAWRCCAGFI